MYRKGKFKCNASLKRPYFVAPFRMANGKMNSSKSSKYLKRETNRKVRRTGIDDLASGCAYKRLIEIWDYNGDLGKLRYYSPLTSDDEDVNHVVIKDGCHYFPK